MSRRDRPARIQEKLEPETPADLNRQPGEAPGNASSEGATPARATAPVAPATEPNQLLAEAPAELQELVNQLRAEKVDVLNTLVRRQADFENYRKRIERERHEEGHRAVALLIEKLLPVLDAFERALAPSESAGAFADRPANEEYRKGFELIYRQLWEALSRQGLERIAAEGKPFDPHVHQAVERVESSEVAEGVVVEELERGYKLRGKVMRPAMVRVAVRPAPRVN